MFGQAGDMQKTAELVRVRKSARLLLRFARLSALLACALAGFLLVGVGSASAYSPSGAEEAEAEAHEEQAIQK
jgi:hypothetical protein